MTPDALCKLIQAALDDRGLKALGGDNLTEEGANGVVLRVPAEVNVAVMDVLRESEELKVEQLVDLFGADTGESVEVTCRLRSLEHKVDFQVKMTLPYGGVLTSVWQVFLSALPAEREVCEMFGLLLEGHPNPKRMLTTEGLPPFLRKEVELRSKDELWK